MGKSQVPAKYVVARTEDYSSASPYPQWSVKYNGGYVVCYCVYKEDAIAIADALTEYTNRSK